MVGGERHARRTRGACNQSERESISPAIWNASTNQRPQTATVTSLLHLRLPTPVRSMNQVSANTAAFPSARPAAIADLHDLSGA